MRQQSSRFVYLAIGLAVLLNAVSSETTATASTTTHTDESTTVVPEGSLSTTQKLDVSTGPKTSKTSPVVEKITTDESSSVLNLVSKHIATVEPVVTQVTHIDTTTSSEDTVGLK